MALTQVQGIRASIFCGSNDPMKSTKFRTPYPYGIPIVIKNSYSDSIGSHCDGGDVCTYYKTCTRVSPGNLNISQLLEINRDTTGFYFTSSIHNQLNQSQQVALIYYMAGLMVEQDFIP